jgi:alpha-L-fucosidase
MGLLKFKHRLKIQIMSIKVYFIFTLIAVSQNIFAQIITPSQKPNRTQELLIKRGYGMFIHFGVNTFADLEWSDGTIPVDTYNPTTLDCDQWVRVARDAGFRYVLLTTKHHDGFCLWDSKFTDYDVASSPVKTDVVAEVSMACKKYGLQFAVYYSLWDRHEPSYLDNNKQRYIDYMLNQLTELFTRYGPICELWFDGGWDRKPEDWGLDKLYRLVKKFQPDCAVGVNHTIVNVEDERNFTIPDSMTIDNKYYFQYFPGDFRLWDPQIAHKLDKKQFLHQGKSYYLPFEHTICLSKNWNWFQKSTPQPVRDLDELEELFYWCTGNDNVLVVDIPPDNTGRIRENEANAIVELGNRLKIRKKRPLPENGRFVSLEAPATTSSVYGNDPAHYGAQLAVDGGLQTRWVAADTTAELIVSLNESDRFNKISIFEYQDRRTSSDGFSNYRSNRIQEYSIDIWKNGQWTSIYTDNKPMDDCKVIRFPRYYQTSKIRLNVLKASAPVSIYEFNVIENDN